MTDKKVWYKKLFEHIGGVNSVILILYSFFVLVTYVYTSKYELSIKFVIRWAFIIFVALVVICPILIQKVSKLSIQVPDKPLSVSEKRRSVMVFFSITLFVLLLYYAAYYPGGFTWDQLGQYRQAVTNEYNDWHPAVHTLLFYKLPLLLSFGWVGSIALFQIILFSMAITYTCNTLLKYAGKVVAIAFLCFVLLNPSNGNMAVHSGRDTAFAMGALLLLTFAIEMVFSHGEWMNQKSHIAVLIIILVLTTLVRHNAILFTLPYAIAILFQIPKKKWFLTVISVIVIVVIIKGPLLMAIGVDKPGKRQGEVLGLPMTVIGDVVANNPKSLDEEVLEFAYHVAPKEVWEEEYESGSFNSIKDNSATNRDVIEEYGTGKVLNYMFRSIAASPREAIQGLIKLTDPVYTLTDDYSYYEVADIAENDEGKELSGIAFLRTINNKYIGAVMMMFPHLFMYVGSMMMILIVSILAKCKLNRRKDWRKILLAIPVLTYNFGTMLLLTGPTDSSRLFYHSFLTIPVLVVGFFLNHDPKQSWGEQKND